MENSTDLKDCAMSPGVCFGLKRKFSVAIEAQPETCSSLSQAKSSNPYNIGIISNCSSTKRSRKSISFESKTENLINLDVTGENVGGNAISEEKTKSDAMDVEKPKGQKVENKVSIVVCEEEHKNDELKEQVPMTGNEAAMVVCGKEHKSDGLKEKFIPTNNEVVAVVSKEENKSDEHNSEMIQMQLVCDEDGVQKDGGDGKAISTLGCYVKPKHVKRFRQSTLNQNLDNDVENEVKSSLMEVSKDYVSKKFPSKLKDFLSSGILEGLPVNYVRSIKTKVATLSGVISGNGIVCSCDICNGANVVTPTIFEVHAGSSNKHPPEYIFLESGNSLRDVMNTFLNIPLGSLEEAVQKVLGGFIVKKSKFCVNCRDVNVVSRLLCNLCMVSKGCQPKPTQAVNTDKDCVSMAVKSRSSEQVVLPKSINNGMKHSASCGKSQGKIIKKDLRLHKLVFEENVLPDGTEVAYYVRGKQQLVGYKKGSGIVCSCCESEVSPSQFEAHAGWASRRKPYLHIYTSNGVSLHELSVSLMKDNRFSTNVNDDLCTICQKRGDLYYCNGCTRAFHTDCGSLLCIPSGTWYCKYCQNVLQKDEHVELNKNAKAAGRIEGINPLEQINQRCIRAVKESEIGGCALCSGQDFSKSFGLRTVMICDQCEKEYHVGCLKDHNMQNLEELPKGNWFCCSDCDQIHTILVNLVARGEETLPDSLLSLIRKKCDDKNLEVETSFDIKWRVLNWKLDESEEANQWLTKVNIIFHEQFDPIIHSCGIDYIPTMLYGDNIKGQDFSGMYCAILTVNKKVVSAAIFRVFGQNVAELPLVATIKDCQGQGYFQSLFTCIETLLGSLKVKNLVLPAANEAKSIWTKKFGFSKLGQNEINNYRRYYYNMMVFLGTSLLSKPVPAV